MDEPRVIAGEAVVPIELRGTDRGFLRGEFRDRDGLRCGIQESSLASQECLWLGSFEGDGRMHLTRARAAALAPLLMRFAATGELIPGGARDDVFAELLSVMWALCDQARDTIWVNDHLTAFEQLWAIYLDLGGAESDLRAAFPDNAGASGSPAGDEPAAIEWTPAQIRQWTGTGDDPEYVELREEAHALRNRLQAAESGAMLARLQLGEAEAERDALLRVACGAMAFASRKWGTASGDRGQLLRDIDEIAEEMRGEALDEDVAAAVRRAAGLGGG